MTKLFTKPTLLTIFGFLFVISLLLFGIIQDFNYFDFGYCMLLVIYLIRYTWVKVHED